MTVAPPCVRSACEASPTSTVFGRCLGCMTVVDSVAACREHVAELTGGMLLGNVRSLCCGQRVTLVRVVPL